MVGRTHRERAFNNPAQLAARDNQSAVMVSTWKPLGENKERCGLTS